MLTNGKYSFLNTNTKAYVSASFMPWRDRRWDVWASKLGLQTVTEDGTCDTKAELWPRPHSHSGCVATLTGCELSPGPHSLKATTRKV